MMRMRRGEGRRRLPLTRQRQRGASVAGVTWQRAWLQRRTSAASLTMRMTLLLPVKGWHLH